MCGTSASSRCRWLGAALFWVFVLMAACVSVSQPQRGEKLVPGNGNGIVVGRIRWLDRDAEQYPWDTDASLDILGEIIRTRPPAMTRPLLGIFSVDRDERALLPAPDSRGWFCWELPAGTYLLYLLDDLHGGDAAPGRVTGVTRLRVLAALQITGQSSPAYVGELVIEIEADWALGSSKATYGITDEQLFSSAATADQWLMQQHPGSAPASLSLMRIDPALYKLLIDYKKSETVAVLHDLGLEWQP